MGEIDEPSVGEPVDPGRRRVLKAAAVAGALSWTAPMMVATPAHANGEFFTPKCDGTYDSNGTISIRCNSD